MSAVNEVGNKLFCRAREEFFSELLAQLTKFDEPLRPIALAFYDNLLAAYEVVRVPYLLGFTVVYGIRAEALQTEELLKMFPTGLPKPLTEQHRQDWKARVDSRLAHEMSSKRDIEAGNSSVLDFLASLLGTGGFGTAAAELLKQSAVSIWSSFEVLAADMAVAIVDHQPAFALKLFKSENTRRYFSPKPLSIEDVAKVGFDLKNCMGQMLFADLRLDKLEKVRDVLLVLLDDSVELARQLKSENLWLLSQRRHLIVHRRGIVDKDYLERTSDTVPIGTALTITSSDIDEYFVLVRNVGIELLRCAQKTISRAL